MCSRCTRLVRVRVRLRVSVAQREQKLHAPVLLELARELARRDCDLLIEPAHVTQQGVCRRLLAAATAAAATAAAATAAAAAPEERRDTVGAEIDQLVHARVHGAHLVVVPVVVPVVLV